MECHMFVCVLKCVDYAVCVTHSWVLYTLHLLTFMCLIHFNLVTTAIATDECMSKRQWHWQIYFGIGDIA